MKSTIFVLLLVNAFNILAMDRDYTEIDHNEEIDQKQLLKKITIPPIDTLKTSLGKAFYVLAYKLGGRALYPVEIFMAIHCFYNSEKDIASKIKIIQQNGPHLMRKIVHNQDIAEMCVPIFFPSNKKPTQEEVDGV